MAFEQPRRPKEKSEGEEARFVWEPKRARAPKSGDVSKQGIKRRPGGVVVNENTFMSRLKTFFSELVVCIFGDGIPEEDLTIYHRLESRPRGVGSYTGQMGERDVEETWEEEFEDPFSDEELDKTTKEQ